jgi:hypothetical protein
MLLDAMKTFQPGTTFAPQYVQMISKGVNMISDRTVYGPGVVEADGVLVNERW